MRNVLHAMAIILVLSACNSKHTFRGVVVDAASHAPLEHVSVTDLDHFNISTGDSARVYTNESGRFSLRYPASELKANGTAPLMFQRSDYNSRVVFFPDEGDTVFLERKEAAPRAVSEADSAKADTASGYTSWTTFWKAFRHLSNTKDTGQLAQLVHFPFIQNGELSPEQEFRALFVKQLFDVRRDEALGPDDFGAQEIAQLLGLPKNAVDSAYYLSARGIDFYFARIHGRYQLARIVTPG
jgi:hypothetical protein